MLAHPALYWNLVGFVDSDSLWFLSPHCCSQDLTIAPLSHQMPPKRDEAALQEEEELQLAIALSQSEAEEKERMVGCTAEISGISTAFAERN